jgi:hypothetical protein
LIEEGNEAEAYCSHPGHLSGASPRCREKTSSKAGHSLSLHPSHHHRSVLANESAGFWIFEDSARSTFPWLPRDEYNGNLSKSNATRLLIACWNHLGEDVISFSLGIYGKDEKEDNTEYIVINFIIFFLH